MHDNYLSFCNKSLPKAPGKSKLIKQHMVTELYIWTKNKNKIS